MLKGPIGLAIVLFFSPPRNADSQSAPTRLGVGVAVDHEFIRLRWGREISDGVLLAIETKGHLLYAVDFANKTATQVGRLGTGPGEYREPAGIHCAGADTSLLEDRQLGRWMLLKGARIVASQTVADQFSYTPILAGGDNFGRVLETRAYKYGQSAGLPRLPIHTHAESLFVIMNDRHSSRRDTLARVRGAFLGVAQLMKPIAPGGSPIPWIVNNPLAIEDQAILFCDGWTAIVRASPYSVEWISRDAVRSAPVVLPFNRVRVDIAEKRAAIERNGDKETFTPDELPGWPEYLPPFTSNALLPLADGRLAIRRVQSARSQPTYDIVDRSGRLSLLELKEKEFVIAFGARSVYVVSTDQDDVQRIWKYPWPD